MSVTVIKGAPPYTTVINNGGTVIVSHVIGVRGPQGPGGGDPAAGDFLATANRLSEFDTPAAKAAARTNLQLENIDCGVFT